MKYCTLLDALATTNYNCQTCQTGKAKITVYGKFTAVSGSTDAKFEFDAMTTTCDDVSTSASDNTKYCETINKESTSIQCASC